MAHPIFETHAHYDDEAFDADREEILNSLTENGIGRVVNIGSSLAACKSCIALSEAYDFIYSAIGVHPSDCGELSEASFAWLSQAARHEKCLAVGEIGLDYHWPEPAPAVQKHWFLRQLDLAREMKKPVVIHSRDAAKDTIDFMRDAHAEEIGGVIHCFSYTKESAKIFLDMGFYIGIGGVLTFSNAKKLKEAVDYIPLDRIVLETDSPYLAPVPNRGKRNSSLNLPYVVSALAAQKNVEEDEVRRITWENACKMYRTK